MKEGNYYRVVVKTEYESKDGKTKVKKDNYVIFGVNPTDVEAKMMKHLEVTDMEIISINLMNIVEVIE